MLPDGLAHVIAGLDGAPGWGADQADRIAPGFPADAFTERTQERAAAWGPVDVVAFDGRGPTQRAWLRGRDGLVRVLAVRLDGAGRIALSYVLDAVPERTAPRLPQDFGPPAPSPTGAALIVMSGVPGTGKSTLADAIGDALGVPVFAGDHLLGALTPFDGYHRDDLLEVGAELLTTLAYRELSAGRSCVLDFPAEDPAVRARWTSLAAARGARLRVVHCVCSDPVLHRARAEGRTRGIPGWHDAADWPDIERRLTAFEPWPADAATAGVVTADAVHPVEANLDRVLAVLNS